LREMHYKKLFFAAIFPLFLVKYTMVMKHIDIWIENNFLDGWYNKKFQKISIFWYWCMC
jgi:hypothetical protein